jgi:hypothetical protein
VSTPLERPLERRRAALEVFQGSGILSLKRRLLVRRMQLGWSSSVDPNLSSGSVMRLRPKTILLVASVAVPFGSAGALGRTCATIEPAAPLRA